MNDGYKERKVILEMGSKKFGEYIDENYKHDDEGLLDKRRNNGKCMSYAKLDGSLFAYIIKEKIDEILNDCKYHCSVNNSYIKGCFTEWDLIISKSKPDYNIYDPDDVECVIELKCGGLTGYNKIDDIKEYFSKFDSCLKTCFDNKKIKFLYISLNESKSKHDLINKEIKRHTNFYDYYVSIGDWQYSKWNKDNLIPTKIADGDTLKKILKDDIGLEL